jgi:ApbE superfamily uncharacterized protein (UPF0280 family)
VPLRTRRPKGFDLAVGDMVLKINAPHDLYEEARAAAMGFWEQLQAYAINNPGFRTSKRPLDLPEDAPSIVRRMAQIAGSVGVGPMFTVPGALTEHVGRTLSRSVAGLVISNGGDYFVMPKKPAKLTVHHRDGAPLSLVVKPELGPVGVYTTMGHVQMPADTTDAVAVMADSCILADAAAAGVMAILQHHGAFAGALTYLRRIPGVHGGIVIRGDRIGLAGGVEIAA